MIKQSSTFVVDRNRIPYAKYIKTFGMHEQAYFYTIDLTKEGVLEQVKKIGLLTENGFFSFSNDVLTPIYYSINPPLQYNLYLVFVMPDDMNLTTDMWKIKENFQHMRKLFLRKREFEMLLSEKQKKEIYSMVSINEERIKIRNFNVLENPGSIQNIEFLKALSTVLKSPIMNIAFPSEEAYMGSIQGASLEALEYYYQKLWSMFSEKGIPNNPYALSATETRMLYLASILSRQEHGQVLLLDGLLWRSLDDARKLNLLTTLADFSEQEGSILVTCDSKADIGLIKKKIYRPNFLNKS